MDNYFQRLISQVLEDNSVSGAFGPSVYGTNGDTDVKAAMSICGGTEPGGKKRRKKTPVIIRRNLKRTL